MPLGHKDLESFFDIFISSLSDPNTINIMKILKAVLKDLLCSNEKLISEAKNSKHKIKCLEDKLSCILDKVDPTPEPNCPPTYCNFSEPECPDVSEMHCPLEEGSPICSPCSIYPPPSTSCPPPSPVCPQTEMWSPPCFNFCQTPKPPCHSEIYSKLCKDCGVSLFCKKCKFCICKCRCACPDFNM